MSRRPPMTGQERRGAGLVTGILLVAVLVVVNVTDNPVLVIGAWVVFGVLVFPAMAGLLGTGEQHDDEDGGGLSSP